MRYRAILKRVRPAFGECCLTLEMQERALCEFLDLQSTDPVFGEARERRWEVILAIYSGSPIEKDVSHE